MVTKRIIPCLDVRDGRVVKGVNFQGLRDVSDPVALAEHYSRSGADELVFYDITASHEGRKDVYKRQVMASAQMIGIALGRRKKRVAVSAWMMLSRARTAPPHQPG